MEDEVLESAINQMVDEHLETVHSGTLQDAPVEIDEQGEALLEAALAAEEVVIPPNSGSLLVDEATSRFSGAIWYSAIQSKTITLAGVGGIGSYVGFLLARLKPDRLYLYDSDVVEQANMSGQLYGSNDLGQGKVYALHNMMQQYANLSLIHISEPTRH